MTDTPPGDGSKPAPRPPDATPIPPKWQEPSAPEPVPLPTWLKVIGWIIALVVGLPLVGALLLFGVCMINAR